jgi:hypothetical protein
MGVSAGQIFKFSRSLALVLVAQACGSPMTSPDEATGSTSQEVAGDCGYTNTCLQYNSCTSWDRDTPGDGVGFTTQSYTQWGTETSIDCDSPGPGCQGDLDGTGCQQQADALRAQLIAQRPGISGPALAGFTIIGTEAFADFTTSGCGRFDQYCDQDTTFSCSLAINNLPDPLSGVRSGCGCAVFQSTSCLPSTVVVGGRGHTCAMVHGGVQWWGANGVGQLGNGLPSDSFTRVTPTGLGSGVYATTAGGQHTCAISGGVVRCWGSNSNGQLGDGQTTASEPFSRAPVQVINVSNAQEISAGDLHSCGIFSGNVWCWGSNGNGRLGNNNLSVSEAHAPGIVQGTSNAQAVTAGGSHTCAIVGGAALCWGSAAQLGNSAVGDSAAPVQVTGLTSGVTAISAGFQHTCALVNGGVKCWGGNDSGQLGDGTTTPRATPVPVPSLTSGVTAIASGQSHTCALLSTGAMQCWGGNGSGQLGIGSVNTPIVNPTTVSGLTSGVQAIYAGYQHSRAVVNGTLECWGNNNNGELGIDPSTFQRTTPNAISDLACNVNGSNPQCVLNVPCADGTSEQTCAGGMVGCAGATTYASRANLCGPTYRPATAAEWVALFHGTAPTHNYWTNDDLFYNGNGPSNCFVSTTTGNDCGIAPMRVCTSAGTDPEGNACNWQHCGLNATAPDGFFGGCIGNTNAGSLCVPNTGCADGSTEQV